MAHFEKVEFPEINRVAFYVTDDYGHRAELSPEQAVTLLKWLKKQQKDLHRLTREEHVPEEEMITIRTLLAEQGITGVTMDEDAIYVNGKHFAYHDELPTGVIENTRAWIANLLAIKRAESESPS